jgi:transposase
MRRRMAKKIISQELKDKIIDMYRNGTEISTIATETKLSERTIYRVVNKALSEKKKKSDSEDEPNIPIKPEKEKERPLDQNLKRRTEQKIVEYGSDVILQDFKLEMRMARILHEKELKYRTSIENLGMNWETFVTKSLDWGYNLVLQTWEDEVQYMVTRDDLEKMAIVQQVYSGSLPANTETREDDINE